MDTNQMQVDPARVINKLTMRLAESEQNCAVLQAVVDMLQEQNAELMEQARAEAAA